jgi:hypothetical protein
MDLLGGMTTDYSEDNGSLIINSVITKGLYAINDINTFYNPVDLQIGTNGSINLIAGSDDTASDKPDNCLSIIKTYMGSDDVYNIQARGENAIAISPADSNTTVYIGDAVFYSDAEFVYLTSYTKKLVVDTTEMSLTGSLHALQSIKVDGQVYTPEVNIIKNISATEDIGYSFRINDTTKNLEIVKFHSGINEIAQLIASFGQGNVENDPDYTVNSYNGSNSGSLSPNTGSSSSGGYWTQSGNDIHYGTNGGTNQKVGIMTDNPSTELEVDGTITSTVFTDGTISIDNGFIRNAKCVQVDSVGTSAGILFKDLKGVGQGYYWNGHASNLYNLDKVELSTFVNNMDFTDFYTGSSLVWFDQTQSQITLSSFSNDLVDFGGDIILSNLESETMVTKNASINLLTSSNATFSNAQAIDFEVSNLTVLSTFNIPSLETTSATLDTTLSVGSTIYASNVETIDLTVSNNLITNNFQVLNNFDASSITALINKLVSDEVNARILNITDTLNTVKLKTSNVGTDLIPDGHEIYDLGSATNKWKDLYLSGSTLYMDDMLLDVTGLSGEKILNIRGGSLVLPKLEFPDGTNMTSVNTIIDSVNEGQTFGDFSGFTMYVNTSRLSVELFSGTYVFNDKHNIANTGNTWVLLEFANKSAIPINSDGTGVNTNAGIIIKRGGQPKDVQLSLISKNRFIGEQCFFTHASNTNINEMFPIRTFDPFSSFFKNKCKTDFNYYYNNKLVEDGFKSRGYTMHFDKGNEYIQINSVEDFNDRNSGNKFYDIEFMFYFQAPLYEVKYVFEEATNEYLISNDQTSRLTKAYMYDGENYGLQTINDDYGLFPRITIQKWDNSVNNTEFSDVIYKSTMGWGAPDTATVFDKFNANGWLKELFKITYRYIKYGFVIGDDTSIPIDVDVEYAKLTANDLVFIIENNLLATDGTTIIENFTSFCFKQSVFAGYF